jgi:hypothetical protein
MSVRNIFFKFTKHTVMADDLTSRFNVAVEAIRALPSKGPIQLSDSDKLAYYAWFKQVLGNKTVCLFLLTR